MQTVFYKIWNLLFPVYCLKCNKNGIYLCENCLRDIPLFKYQFCPNCKNKNYNGGFCDYVCKNEFYFDYLIIAGKYNNLLRAVIAFFKYKFCAELANSLSILIFYQLQKFYKINNLKDFLLIPVPLSKKRLRFRGFNQSLILTKLLSSKLNIPYIDILIRDHLACEQVGLKREQRLTNLKNAFSLKKYEYDLKNKKIILIDDVITTGCTLNECSKILKLAGAKEIICLVIARG